MALATSVTVREANGVALRWVFGDECCIKARDILRAAADIRALRRKYGLLENTVGNVLEMDEDDLLEELDRWLRSLGRERFEEVTT